MNKQKYKKSKDLRTRLLDISEELFSQKGYFGTSIRDITEQAGVRNASVNYHFMSKERLFLAVIERRIEPLSKARIDKLETVEIDPNRPENSIRGIVDAFAYPMLDKAMNGGVGWRNYCILVAHLAVQKFWTDNTISEKYDEHAKKFIQAFELTFPAANKYRVHCCFQLMLSATLYAVCDNKRIDTLSKSQYRSQDIESFIDPFMDFVTAGILGSVEK